MSFRFCVDVYSFPRAASWFFNGLAYIVRIAFLRNALSSSFVTFTGDIDCIVEFCGVYPIDWDIDDVVEFERMETEGEIIAMVDWIEDGEHIPNH